MNKEEIEKIIFHSLKQIAPETDPSGLLPTDNIREELNINIPEQDYGKIVNLKLLTDYLLEKKKTVS